MAAGPPSRRFPLTSDVVYECVLNAIGDSGLPGKLDELARLLGELIGAVQNINANYRITTLYSSTFSYTNSGATIVDYTVASASVSDPGKLVVQMYASAAVVAKLSLTRGSVSASAALNAGLPLSPGSWYEFEITVAGGESVSVSISLPPGASASGYAALLLVTAV